MKILYPFLFLFIISGSCISSRNKEPIYYEYKRIEFTRQPDTIKEHMLYLERIRYDKANDSSILFFAIVDSIQSWNSSNYRSSRDTVGWEPTYKQELDSIWEIQHKKLLSLKYDMFDFPGINQKTKIINLNGIEENDTLIFESKKEISSTNVYSFYFRFNGDDGDYRLYIADSIGPIAFCSVAWRTQLLLNKVINSKDLDNKLNRVKTQLLADTLFFPAPKDSTSNVIYIPPRELK